MRLASWMIGAVLVTSGGCASNTGGAGGGCPNDLPPSCPPGAAGYAATIAPILRQECVTCHEPGGVSVHYLQTYEDVYNLRASVLTQVYACKMPQAGYPPLTAAERADLLGWLVCGAPND